jgi:hypothetical protein
VEGGIYDELARLIGLPLWAAGRAGSLLWLQFGDRVTQPTAGGGTREVGTYALHVSGAWRLSDLGGIITGSGDLLTPADPNADLETFDWGVQGASLWDHRLAGFVATYAASPPVVERVHADRLGDARLLMSQGITFETFVESSAADHLETEFWRLFRPGEEAAHYVVDTNGAYHDG